MAFAHWDVEHAEFELLQGARRTLARDRPWFTVEAHLPTAERCGPLPPMGPGADHAAALRESAQAKLRLASSMGFRAFILEEPCGAICGCRNVLCVPEEHVARWVASPVYAAFEPLLTPWHGAQSLGGGWRR